MADTMDLTGALDAIHERDRQREDRLSGHADYSAIPALNWSRLKHMATSPRLYRWREEHTEPDKPAYAFGRLVHCALLEPDRWDRDYVVQPDFGDQRRTANKEALAAWTAEHADAQIVSADDYERVSRIVDAIRGHRAANRVLTGGRTEETIQWTDRESGLRCKMRGDFISPEYLADLKTTRRATIRQMVSDLTSYLYHGQIAWYHDGAREAGVLPLDAERPFIVFAQSVEPWDVVVVRMGEEALSAGRSLCRSLVRRYEECTAAKWWPGMAPDVLELDRLPAWAAGSDEEEGSDDF